MHRTTAKLVLALVAVALAASCSSSSKHSTTNGGSSAAHRLVGLFEIDAGTCTASGASGSYFRMIQSGGSVAGPFVANQDSPCTDKTWTTVQPGTDGGLRTGAYQPQPTPPFTATGGSAATSIFKPQAFFGILFGGSTNPKDPQSGQAVPVPTITATGGVLSGDLSAVSVSWNGQYFNQGSPKPGGATSAGTVPVAGTYDASTGRFTLTWTSQITGGPFDKFAGTWHLEGRFVPAS